MTSFAVLKSKKLLLIGPSKNSVHVKNYFHLVGQTFHEVLVVTDEHIDYARFKIIDFRLNIGIFRSVRTLRRIIDKYKPDIIHVHQANSCAFITALANFRRFPLVLTCWGSDVLLMPSRGPLSRFIVKYSLKKADLVTADAKHLIEAVKKLVPEKICVHANFGIQVDKVSWAEKLNVIYSNRLHKSLYNVDKIILGFGEFVKRHPDWKLLIGGGGEETDNLKRLASEKLLKEHVNFVGFVNQDENRRNYHLAKIWVSIPASDGTSISLLEAMASGCIPVVSDLPANHEWITDAQNGVIVRSDDLCAAFECALTLNLHEVAKENEAIILRRGTREANRTVYLKSYLTLLK